MCLTSGERNEKIFQFSATKWTLIMRKQGDKFIKGSAVFQSTRRHPGSVCATFSFIDIPFLHFANSSLPAEEQCESRPLQ